MRSWSPEINPLKVAWRLAFAALLAGLCACAALPGPTYPNAGQIGALLPADAILLGEQHDAPDHQLIHRLVVETLAAQHKLAALALEMAPEGRSTAALTLEASEDAAQDALQWGQGTWSWATYGPIVMAAVRAGVPVVGANLPKTQVRESMADPGLELLLPKPALRVMEERIRVGHCDLLPESQVAPMTRIQIARDIAMARTVAGLVRPGQTVLLLAGSGHVDRQLGVPQHLPATLRIKAVLLHGEPPAPVAWDFSAFDVLWSTRPAPPSDHCADFKAHRTRPAAAPPAEQAS